jgi:hypothetical protein
LPIETSHISSHAVQIGAFLGYNEEDEDKRNIVIEARDVCLLKDLICECALQYNYSAVVLAAVWSFFPSHWLRTRTFARFCLLLLEFKCLLSKRLHHAETGCLNFALSDPSILSPPSKATFKQKLTYYTKVTLARWCTAAARSTGSSGGKLMSCQNNLAHLPVPHIGQTIDKFLMSVERVLPVAANSDKAALHDFEVSPLYILSRIHISSAAEFVTPNPRLSALLLANSSGRTFLQSFRWPFSLANQQQSFCIANQRQRLNIFFLQNVLRQRALDKPNWLNDWWEEFMYVNALRYLSIVN